MMAKITGPTEERNARRAERENAARENLAEEYYAEFHFGRQREPLEDLVRRVIAEAIEDAWERGRRAGAVG